MSEGTESKDAERVDSGDAGSAESNGDERVETRESPDAESAESPDSAADESAESKGDEGDESQEAEGDETNGDESSEGAESKGDDKLDAKQARLEIAGGDAIAVDVRSDDDWTKGHIPGAIHLPEGDPENATKPLEEGARLVVIADKGKAAVSAAKELAEKGYNAAAFNGSMKDWTSAGYAVQPTEDPDDDTELGAG